MDALNRRKGLWYFESLLNCAKQASAHALTVVGKVAKRAAGRSGERSSAVAYRADILSQQVPEDTAASHEQRGDRVTRRGKLVAVVATHASAPRASLNRAR